MLLELPYPPSINNYWIASGHRRFISKRGVLFRQAVAEYVIEHGVPKLGDQALSVHIILRPDSLENAGVFSSDVQVEKLLIERGLPIKNGGCVVLIEVIPSSSEENPQG
jgi:Holliday junction resolvase RusA-like endonuclease